MTTPRALCTPDIVHEIVQSSWNYPIVERRRLLVSLVRVNKAFHDPALRILWAEMDSLEPLIALLTTISYFPVMEPGVPVERVRPARLRDTFRCPHSKGITGDVPAEDWDNVRRYANFIRVLDLPRGDPAYPGNPRRHLLEPASLFMLVNKVGQPLFPKLTRLALPVTPPYDAQNMWFFSPSLRQLTLSFQQEHAFMFVHGIRSFFYCAFVTTPRITELRFETESYQGQILSGDHFSPWPFFPKKVFWNEDHTPKRLPGICRALSYGLALLHDLEVFDMIAFRAAPLSDLALLHVLLSLRKLHTLTLALRLDAPDYSQVTRGFSSLRSLVVAPRTHEDFLKLFPSPFLQELAIYPDPNMPPDTCRNIMDTIGRSFPQLQRLAWKPCSHLGDEDVHDLAVVNVLEPLFQLESLTNLSVDLSLASVGDEHLSRLAAAFPRLTHFSLYFERGSPSSQRPTARALLAFAQLCPALVTFHLGAAYIAEGTAKSIEQACPTPHHNLRTLYIRYLRCADEASCARIVDRLFPSLDLPEARRTLEKDAWRTRPSSEVSEDSGDEEAGEGHEPMPNGQWDRVVDRLEELRLAH